MLKEGAAGGPDRASAARLFLRAIEGGELGEAAAEADALFNLGLLYLEGVEGLGPPHEAVRDPIGAAVALFGRAADRGSAEAAHNLGVAHLKGAGGLARDPARALLWFARAGTADAMYAASTVSPDPDQAREWLRRAARAGHAKAAAQLASQPAPAGERGRDEL